MLLNGPDRYGVISRAVHWITALLFFVMLGIGLLMSELLEDSGALGESLLFLHPRCAFSCTLCCWRSPCPAI